MTKPMKAEEASKYDLLRILAKALPGMWRSAPLLVSLMFLLGIVQGFTPALTILIGKWTVDGIAEVAQGSQINLTLLALAWAVVALIGQLTELVSRVLQGYVADHFTVQTVHSLMVKMQQLPGLDVVEDPKFHDDIELLQTGAPFRPLNLTSVTLTFIGDLAGIIGMALTLALVGWWVPLVVIAGMLPLARKQMSLYELGWSMTVQKTQEARELNYDQRVAVRHESAKEVRLYDLIPFIAQRYLRQAHSYQAAMRSVRNRQLLAVMPLNVLNLAVTAGVFIYVVLQAGRGELSVGSVVLVTGSLGQMRERLRGTSEMFGLGAQHLMWFQKYYAFLDAVPSVSQPPVPQPLPAKLDLTLDGVSFGYRGQKAVLEDVTLHIPEGQIVAIVGENGAGKTTLVKLLLRFYDPTAGSIRLGAAGEQTDLRDVDLDTWRSQIAAVFQDFARFEWTLRENVLLGQPEQESKLSAALQASGMNPVLEQVEGGLEARIGQAFGGVDLSGGQWQKLATARALYRDARVLILDEPTAALDPRSEAEVFAAFTAMSRGRTTLLITHRLGSVLMADRILVMKRGRLIEDGTHAELLAAGGEYAELWRLQADQYATEMATPQAS